MPKPQRAAGRNRTRRTPDTTACALNFTASSLRTGREQPGEREQPGHSEQPGRNEQPDTVTKGHLAQNRAFRVL
eukprot:9547622-Alexandrium_andersonii.AAC.1